MCERALDVVEALAKWESHTMECEACEAFDVSEGETCPCKRGQALIHGILTALMTTWP